MRTLSIRDTEADAEDADNGKKSPATAVTRKPKMGVSKTAVNLPSIHSNEWEFEEMQLPPGPKSRRT